MGIRRGTYNKIHGIINKTVAHICATSDHILLDNGTALSFKPLEHLAMLQHLAM